MSGKMNSELPVVKGCRWSGPKHDRQAGSAGQETVMGSCPDRLRDPYNHPLNGYSGVFVG